MAVNYWTLHLSDAHTHTHHHNHTWLFIEMRRVSITETAKHFCAWKWNAIHFAIYVYLNANLTFGVLYAHHPQHRYKCDAISEAHGLKPSDTADTWKKRVCNFVSLSQCIKYECNLVSLMQNGITFMTTNESPFSWSIGCHWLRCQATRSFVMHEAHRREKSILHSIDTAVIYFLSRFIISLVLRSEIQCRRGVERKKKMIMNVSPVSWLLLVC